MESVGFRQAIEWNMNPTRGAFTNMDKLKSQQR